MLYRSPVGIFYVVGMIKRYNWTFLPLLRGWLRTCTSLRSIWYLKNYENGRTNLLYLGQILYVPIWYYVQFLHKSWYDITRMYESFIVLYAYTSYLQYNYTCTKLIIRATEIFSCMSPWDVRTNTTFVPRKMDQTLLCIKDWQFHDL